MYESIDAVRQDDFERLFFAAGLPDSSVRNGQVWLFSKEIKGQTVFDWKKAPSLPIETL